MGLVNHSLGSKEDLNYFSDMPHFKDKEIQLQYEGYINTPLLWQHQDVYGLQQLDIHPYNISNFNQSVPEGLRLGKRVERFVSHELSQDEHTTLLVENIQIQKDKRTLGELDALLLYNDQPIHLEIVYKFYLYDARVGDNELDHWIGPNRKDTLVKKLDKLKNKQLPLLFNPHTQPLLQDLNLDIKNLQQRVLFKAQLFTPYNDANISFELLNKTCIKGFYISFKHLKVLDNNKFYIPNKINWLSEKQTQSNWLPYDKFYEAVNPYILNKTSPLCWVKFPNGIVQKFFVAWWD